MIINLNGEYEHLGYENKLLYHRVYRYGTCVSTFLNADKTVSMRLNDSNIRIDRRNRRPTRTNLFASRPGHDAAVAVRDVRLLHPLHLRAATPSPIPPICR